MIIFFKVLQKIQINKSIPLNNLDKFTSYLTRQKYFFLSSSLFVAHTAVKYIITTYSDVLSRFYDDFLHQGINNNKFFFLLIFQILITDIMGHPKSNHNITKYTCLFLGESQKRSSFRVRSTIIKRKKNAFFQKTK